MRNNSRYLIRLDDACPTMDETKWGRMEALLDKHGVKPMIGIVPACEDKELLCQQPDPAFWEKAQKWQEKGYAIALHGYNHVYSSNEGLNGLNPMWKRSEFAGVALDEQRKKIREGIKVLKENGITCEYFFAPSHTFDENTLEALRIESDIRIISDTVSLRPYLHNDFIMIPQVVSLARTLPISGIYTFCYHPNLMQDSEFEQLDSFIGKNQSSFISFKDIQYIKMGGKSLLDKLLSSLYFMYHEYRNRDNN